MKILVIGGTQFVGRAIVDQLLARGHEVTLFYRGKTNRGLFDGVEEIFGDRNTDLGLLAGKTWDAVVDTCAYLPGQVAKLNDVLGDSGAYLQFVSTRSVYAKDQGVDVPETGELLPAVTTDEEINGETYGPMKVACENLIAEGWKGGWSITRPGVIIGPHDHTDRFNYWPLRFREGGKILVPDVREEPVTGVDVRDLAAFTVGLIERGVEGVFNVDTDGGRFGDVIDACAEGVASDRELVWVDKEKLDGVVQAWVELPIWGNGAFNHLDVSKAKGEGMTWRPLVETVRDIVSWCEETGRDFPLAAGWTLEREKSVLEMLD